MGMIWRSTMPLLSTLAALVIIVHSQEDMERGYRRELRPRVVDTASYEQPWKAIDMEPLLQHSTRAEVWNESAEEAPARRRPVRKRKRRPQPYYGIEPQERHQESIQGTNHDIDYHDSQQTMETTRKRRKRPDINHYLAEDPINPDERPLKRRGLRRKRPIDYDVAMPVFISPETGDEFITDKGVNNFSKYNQFDYDEPERNTESTNAYITVDTDNQANRLKTLISNAENSNISAYNKTFSAEEPRKVFGDSTISLHAAEPGSSSAVDENERLKLIQEMRAPMTNREQSKDENEDIMVMIKKSKVSKLKLGIIINGTEHSYLPLPIPLQEANYDYDNSIVTTPTATIAGYSWPNAEERNYFHLSAEENIVDDQPSKTFVSISNSAINAGWSQATAPNGFISADVLADNSEKSKKILKYVTKEPERIHLQTSTKKVISISSKKKLTEKSNNVISISHGIHKPKYFNGHASSASEKDILVKGVLSGNTKTSLADVSTVPNYINLPLLSDDVIAIYEIGTESTENPVTEHVSKVYEVNNYFQLLTPTSKDVTNGEYAKNETEKSKSIFRIEIVNNENKYFPLPTQVHKVIIDADQYSKDNTERSNSVFDSENGDKGSDYFSLKKPVVVVIADRGHTEHYTEKSNVAFDFGNSENGNNEKKYFPLPTQVNKVIIDADEYSKGNAERSNSVFHIGNSGKGSYYFSLQTPEVEVITDRVHTERYTEKSNVAFDLRSSENGNNKNKYFPSPTQLNKVIIDAEDNTEHSNSVFDFGNGDKGNNYFSLQTPEVITDRVHTENYTEKSNVAFNLGKPHNKQEYFPLPRPIIKVYTDFEHLKGITENSNRVFNSGNLYNEHKYFPLPVSVNESFGDSGYSKDNIVKSSLRINLSTTQNALDLTSPKNEPLTENSNLRKVINTSTGQAYSGSGHIKYSKERLDNNMIYTKKWINTNKWIAKIKLQFPRLTPAENNEIEAFQAEYEENGIIEPMMLKQILKRSNGSSLSEMLQRHNLSLTDLLQGKDEAISALNNAEAFEEPQLQLSNNSPEDTHQHNEAVSKYPTRQESSQEQKLGSIESNSDEETIVPTTEKVEAVTDSADVVQTDKPEMRQRLGAQRRFPGGIRRKLRMRPMLNSTLKAQLSRDLIALSARKYSRNNRNVTKSKEWKDIVPLMADRSNTTDETSKDDATEPTPTTTEIPVDTTVASLDISNTSYSSNISSNTLETGSEKENEIENTVSTTTEPTTTIIIEVFPSELTERPKVTPIVRPGANNSTLRRQAFNNRLKRKRLKHKSSTTENPNDDLMKNFLGMANLVSASQFIERTQKPYTTLKQDNTEFATELEDFLTTQPPRTVSGDGVKSTQNGITRFTTSTARIVSQSSSTSTTEQSAKFEIEEILNDTMTSERLAKILRERNMTLSELVSHRERGSSHVHLADIFHNASKEPNPPEPFLTKSSIEPISKETYPLRAILEANTHETTTRPMTTQADQKNQHIPVVMDFGNNVNENGESMGIMSLFNKFTDNDLSVDKTELRKDSDGTPYVSSVISVNATNANDTSRESRVLANGEDWKILLSFMKEHNISTFEEDLHALSKGDPEKESLDEDLEGDGLMVLEDMQHLQNFDSNIASGLDEDLQVNMYERRENLSDTSGTLSNISGNTKSVAIATASILGLGAILFLLTYVAFKWKQQRDKLKSKLRKKESFCAGPIPSPVFENRKGHKHNCSSRSISPMISNTNIYMSTLDSRNGNESPDYTWNSLRKPFQ